MKFATQIHVSLQIESLKKNYLPASHLNLFLISHQLYDFLIAAAAATDQGHRFYPSSETKYQN